MRVLALTRYDRAGPSSRLRFMQFLPALAARGIDVTVAPVLDDDYIDASFSGRGTTLKLLRGYLKRVAQARSAHRYDLVWLEKELLNWIPLWAEQALLPSHTPLVIDYDDAVFHRYDQSPYIAVRALLSSKHPWLARRASLIVAGNDYLAAQLRAYGPKRVETLPTVVDTTRYPVTPQPPGKFTVGWIGSPATELYLRDAGDALRRVAATGPLKLRCIGLNRAPVDGIECELRPWGEDSEARDLTDCHVGIMPLRDTPWERGKCGYKLIQYLACARPAVASPVGVNASIVRPGINGFLASSEDEWAAHLTALRDNAALREKMGQAGRAIVESEYSLASAAPRLAQLLTEAAGA
jgi:glycosyltransferase involved in cell wall biosynthesis